MALHHHHRKTMVSPELAIASDLFDKFCGAATLKTILSNYRNLCEILHMKPTNYPQFYPKLKVLYLISVELEYLFALLLTSEQICIYFQIKRVSQSKLCSWRAQALWNKFDKRANHKCYNRGKACPNTRVSLTRVSDYDFCFKTACSFQLTEVFFQNSECLCVHSKMPCKSSRKTVKEYLRFGNSRNVFLFIILARENSFQARS